MNNILFFLIGRGVILGFSAASVPGPMQGYLINTSLKFGWRKALYIIASPLIVDIPIILTVLFALETMEAVVPQIVDGIRIIGGLFVLYLAWGAMQDLRQDNLLTATDTTQSISNNGISILGRAMLLNLLSPGPYIFWTTVNGPLLKQGLEQSVGHGVAFLIAFYGTFLSGLIAIAVFIDWLRRLDKRVSQGILVFTIILLVGLGVWLLYEGVSAFVAF